MKDFDLARLRRNWDRAVEPPPPPLAPRLALVERPIDPLPEAVRLFGEIRDLIRVQCAGRTPDLTLFLVEAADLLTRLQAATTPGADTKDDPAALQEQLEKALFDLEDLLEVVLGIGLPQK